MVKRVIIKTILICFGVFLVLTAIAAACLLKKYPLDTEKYTPVVIATADIKKGAVVGEHDVITKVIQMSAKNSAMATDINMVIGKKAISDMEKNDYIKTRELLSREDWFAEDERIIILPVSIEERLANLINMGSYIDILVKNEKNGVIEPVLCKVRAEDILDESGTPLDSKTGMNSSTAYMKLILDKSERGSFIMQETRGSSFMSFIVMTPSRGGSCVCQKINVDRDRHKVCHYDIELGGKLIIIL